VSPRHLHLFLALKQTLDDRKHKEDSEAESVVTRWLITHDAEF
jgi:hypothetical protein